MVSFGISRVVIYICTKYIFESLRLPRYAKEEERQFQVRRRASPKDRVSVSVDGWYPYFCWVVN